VTDAAPANMQPNAEVGELLSRATPERARAIFEQGATARRLAEVAPHNLASLRGFFERQPQHITAELLQRISADGPGVTEDEVRALKVPALVIGTQADAIHPIAHAQRLAAMLKHSEFVEITAKSVSREAYVQDMHRQIAHFIHKVAS
jgi:pimeloyl-ACP methyl ester carboxylesterase